MTVVFTENPERTLLGTIINDPSLLPSVEADGLVVDHFQSPWREIFAKLLHLKKEKLDCDVNTIIFGTTDTITAAVIDCVSHGTVSTNIKFWVQAVKRNSVRRNVSLALSKLAADFASADDFSKFEQAKTRLIDISASMAKDQTTSLEDEQSARLVHSLIDALECRVKNFKSGIVPGIKTGFQKLDKVMGGFCASRLVTLSARTGVGKTSMAINFMHHALLQKKSVCYFTVEMTSLEILEKLVSLRSPIDSNKLFTGDFGDEDLDRIVEATRNLYQCNFTIVSKFDRTIQSIESIAKLLREQNQNDFTIVDYAGLIVSRNKHETRQRECSEISGALKQLSSELEIPVLCLVQVNRTGLKSDQSPPTLANLRESDSFGLDSNVALILHNVYDDNKNVISRRIIIDKNRHGDEGEIEIEGDLSICRFREKTNG